MKLAFLLLEVVTLLENIVYYFFDDESLEVKHIAYSRAVYAKGALKAAKLIINKPAGFYPR